MLRPVHRKRTTRSLAPGAAVLIILGCGGGESVGPTEPEPLPPPDVIAPTASMALPAANAELDGRIELRAGAQDNVGVAGVQFLVDGEPYGAELRLAPYRTTFDTRSVADGPHTFAVRARDAAGLTAVSEPVAVTVYNDPGVVELTIEAPDGLNDHDGFEVLVDVPRGPATTTSVVVGEFTGTGTFTLEGIPAGRRRLRAAGLPPFCGADEQVVTVRSTAPASAVLTIRCMATSAAQGWLLVSRSIGVANRLVALSLRSGRETVLVPDLGGLGAVSPDGTRLAFIDDGVLMIGELGAFAPVAVASVPGAWEVSWAPDGSSLVLAMTGGLYRDLYLVDADGSDLRPLFDTPGYRRRPVWSVTGRIAFEVASGGPMGDDTAIWAVDPDGGNPVQLSPGYSDEFPAWSPDGTRLAFTRWGFTSTSSEVQVAVVNADGTGAERVASNEAGGAPIWSPDGNWLVHSVPGELVVTHISGAPTMSVIGFAAQTLGWVAGDRFD